MKLSKEIISKIIDWYEEYEDSNNPNNISAEQYISNKLSWENPIDEEELEELAKESRQFAISLASDANLISTFTSYENSFKAGYRKALEYD